MISADSIGIVVICTAWMRLLMQSLSQCGQGQNVYKGWNAFEVKDDRTTRYRPIWKCTIFVSDAWQQGWNEMKWWQCISPSSFRSKWPENILVLPQNLQLWKFPVTGTECLLLASHNRQLSILQLWQCSRMPAQSPLSLHSGHCVTTLALHKMKYCLIPCSAAGRLPHKSEPMAAAPTPPAANLQPPVSGGFFLLFQHVLSIN